MHHNNCLSVDKCTRLFNASKSMKYYSLETALLSGFFSICDYLISSSLNICFELTINLKEPCGWWYITLKIQYIRSKGNVG